MSQTAGRYKYFFVYYFSSKTTRTAVRKQGSTFPLAQPLTRVSMSGDIFWKQEHMAMTPALDQLFDALKCRGGHQSFPFGFDNTLRYFLEVFMREQTVKLPIFGARKSEFRVL